MKLTPRIMGDSVTGKATAETWFPKLVEVFGAKRLAWGSNFPTSPGTLSEILATARERLASLSAEDQGWVFGKTALSLYPKLGA
jgi:L-fuconolactonase